LKNPYNCFYDTHKITRYNINLNIRNIIFYHYTSCEILVDKNNKPVFDKIFKIITPDHIIEIPREPDTIERVKYLFNRNMIPMFIFS